MPNTLRDGFSNFKFFQALAPQDVAAGAATNGDAVDIKGYETATIVVNVGAPTGGGAMSVDCYTDLFLEHYNSVAGAWSEVYYSQMINANYSAGTALNSGLFQRLQSVTSYANQAYAVGYKGPHRTIRLRISDVGTNSTYSIGAVAILGLPNNWPVNTPA